MAIREAIITDYTINKNVINNAQYYLYKCCAVLTKTSIIPSYNVNKTIFLNNWNTAYCPNITIVTKDTISTNYIIDKTLIKSIYQFSKICNIPGIYNSIINKYIKYPEIRKIDGRNN